MNRIALLIIVAFVCPSLYSQTTTKISVVIVACKTGELIIDGASSGNVEADDASKQMLSLGEHYVQLKTPTEKISLTIKVDENSKEIIKLGCAASSNPAAIRLINKEVDLAGALSAATEQNVFGLDKDDILDLNCSILNKKGTATLTLIEYKTGRSIYRKENFNSVVDKVRIPEKGVYYFTLTTDALFGKTAKLVIDRIPSERSAHNFNTSARWVYDTTGTEVTNSHVRVFSTTNGHSKTTVTINLPKNTAYWTYWLGVDQAAQDKMKQFAANLSTAGKYFTANPLLLFGLKLIPELPMLNTPATVNYHFMDTKNAQSFVANQAYRFFTFKHADNITTDYSTINTKASDLVIAFDNQSPLNGHDVELRVVAFVVKSRIVMEE